MIQHPSPKSTRPSARSESSPLSPSSCRSFAPLNSDDAALPGLPSWMPGSTDDPSLRFEPQNPPARPANLTQPNPTSNLGNGANNVPMPTPVFIARGQLQGSLSPTQQDTRDGTADDMSTQSYTAEKGAAIPYESPQSPEQEVSFLPQAVFTMDLNHSVGRCSGTLWLESTAFYSRTANNSLCRESIFSQRVLTAWSGLGLPTIGQHRLS